MNCNHYCKIIGCARTCEFRGFYQMRQVKYIMVVLRHAV